MIRLQINSNKWLVKLLVRSCNSNSQLFLQLPLLDLDGLDNHKELRLAHKILAFITSVYVWQDGEGGETEVGELFENDMCVL